MISYRNKSIIASLIKVENKDKANEYFKRQSEIEDILMPWIFAARYNKCVIFLTTLQNYSMYFDFLSTVFLLLTRQNIYQLVGLNDGNRTRESMTFLTSKSLWWRQSLREGSVFSRNGTSWFWTQTSVKEPRQLGCEYETPLIENIPAVYSRACYIT